MPTSSKATLAALATVALWASAFPLIRVGLRAFDPLALAALRFAVAALCVTAWLLWRRPALPPASDVLRLTACALLGIAAYNILLNSGQRSVPAAAASFIINTVPVLTALLAVALLGERLSRSAAGGSVISFCGVGVIAHGQAGGLNFGGGSGLIVAAAACQALFFTLQRPLVARHGALPCAALVILAGALSLTPWLPRAVFQAAAAAPTQVLAVVYLGVFPAAVGYATWAVAQAYFGASRAANFLYLVPPLATLLALPIAAETPGLSTVAGGALAIAGVLVVSRSRRIPNAQHSSAEALFQTQFRS